MFFSRVSADQFRQFGRTDPAARPAQIVIVDVGHGQGDGRRADPDRDFGVFHHEVLDDELDGLPAFGLGVIRPGFLFFPL